MSGCGCGPDEKELISRRVLLSVFWINSIMFLTEGILGWLADSSGLLADSLDMLADAAVYAIALSAVGKNLQRKKRAASVSGYLQIGLGGLVLADVVRKLITGSEPVDWMIMGTAFVALVANSVCLFLLNPHQKGEAHMRASWIFTKNDVIANAGVLLAGLLVLLTDSFLPDLMAGVCISALVIRGGWQILRENEPKDNLNVTK